MKVCLVILDGLYDVGKNTPLKMAKTPNFDKVLKDSDVLFSYPLPNIGEKPESETAHLEIFGYNIESWYFGRGIYEALGYFDKINPDWYYFRVNFATVDKNLTIIDRRAGRNGKYIEELCKEINEIDDRFEVIHTVEHRGILIIKDELNLSLDCGNDPHKIGVRPNKICKELDKWLIKVHKILNKSKYNKLRKLEGLLPANYLLIRGCGKLLKKPISFKDKYGLSMCCIAGAPLYKGIAKFIGGSIIKVSGATGTVNTNLRAKAETVLKMKNKYDFVFIHVKGTDSLSHDKKRVEKKEFIERIDKELISIIKDEFDILIIGADHTTSSIDGNHKSHPCVFLVKHENARINEKNKKFSEFLIPTYGYIYHRNLMNVIMNFKN